MYDGNLAEIRMRNVYSPLVDMDDRRYSCRVTQGEEEGDFLYLKLEKAPLSAISLDAKYYCYIQVEDGVIYCTGVVQERFQGEDGNMVVFRVEDGFYKGERKRL